MTMRRPQFSLKTLLWLMAVVGAFLAGIEWDRRHPKDERRWLRDKCQRLEAYQQSQWRSIWTLHEALEKHGINRSEISEIDDPPLFREPHPSGTQE